MRLRRKRNRLRAYLKSKELVTVSDKTARLSRDVVQCYSTIQNENVRLPFFLKYYRDLGVGHFLIVDNDSDDGGREYLAEQVMFRYGPPRGVTGSRISGWIG